jgi:CubicO group peptidase (beta-lactamase class C family)
MSATVFVIAGAQPVFRDEVPGRDSLFARAHVGPPNPYVWGTRGAGGVWSTVGDIYRWVVAVEDKVVLREPQHALLFLRLGRRSRSARGPSRELGSR